MRGSGILLWMTAEGSSVRFTTQDKSATPKGESSNWRMVEMRVWTASWRRSGGKVLLTLASFLSPSCRIRYRTLTLDIGFIGLGLGSCDA